MSSRHHPYAAAPNVLALRFSCPVLPCPVGELQPALAAHLLHSLGTMSVDLRPTCKRRRSHRVRREIWTSPPAPVSLACIWLFSSTNCAQAPPRRANKLEAPSRTQWHKRRVCDRGQSASQAVSHRVHRTSSVSVSVLAAVSPIVEDMTTSSGSCRRKVAAVVSEMCLAKQRKVAEKQQRES